MALFSWPGACVPAMLELPFVPTNLPVPGMKWNKPNHPRAFSVMALHGPAY